MSVEEVKEKTVEEILKEEGVIKPEEPRRAEVKVLPKDESFQLKAINIAIEKLTAEVNALKGMNHQASERIMQLTESIGEMRSLIFQRDATIKENERRIGKLEDVVSEINPENIKKEIQKRDKKFGRNEAKVEKLERISDDLVGQMKLAKAKLDSIKSVENLANLNREIAKKITEMEQLKSSTQRSAAKAEGFFMEMDKTFAELLIFKEKVTKLEGLSKELVREVDQSKIALKKKASKEDLEGLRVTILSNIGETVKSMQKDMEKALDEILDLVTQGVEG
jgi:chromosome segregation ATPase